MPNYSAKELKYITWLYSAKTGYQTILKVKNWKTVAKSRDAGENFWRRPGLTKGCRAIEEEGYQTGKYKN
ncbi:hypothetical protein TNCV_2168121 [Trichonephila clavipes]|nr:hypothetical protein TNCV_2168121 [Trichonephila clavipes]